ncbi:MAG TPA: hypothetical protein ENJ93_01850 [Chloroflexi bacterium]|nr:hypothetical protein [Chloroflexota bacterium]
MGIDGKWLAIFTLQSPRATQTFFEFPGIRRFARFPAQVDYRQKTADFLSAVFLSAIIFAAPLIYRLLCQFLSGICPDAPFICPFDRFVIVFLIT